MTVAQLKEELARRGLPVGGRKAELAARLSSQVAPPPRRTAAAQSAGRGSGTGAIEAADVDGAQVALALEEIGLASQKL